MPGWACKFSRPNGKKELHCVAKRRIELTERANYCIMMMYIQVKWVYRLKTRRRRHRLDWRVVEARDIFRRHGGSQAPAQGGAMPFCHTWIITERFSHDR